MKHLYVTLDYSRFEVIPTGVILSQENFHRDAQSDLL